ncbi:MAG: hypothetical protein V4663_03945 [Bacteroidota bacterium]
MKTNLKTVIAIFALALPILFTACKKDNVEPQPNNEITSVKFSFTGTKNIEKIASVDLSKAKSVKIDYTIADGSNQVQIIKQAELAVTGDNVKVSTIDQKVFTVKGGSTINVQSAILLDASGKIIATIAGPDSFKAETPMGSVLMERAYPVSGLEK